MEWSEALLISAPGLFTEQMPSLIVDTVSSLSNQGGESRRLLQWSSVSGMGKGQGIRPVSVFPEFVSGQSVNIFPLSYP